MASKYDPLSRYLESLDATAWYASFREIESILNFPLRASARNHRSWWHNNTIGHPQASAWMSAGWKTTGVDMGAETLVFRRVGPSVLETKTSEVRRTPESVSRENTPVNPPVPCNPRSRGFTDEGRMPFDLDRLMHGLSQARPIFHSARDFQHVLASHIHKVLPDCQVQLNFPIPIPGKNLHLDIWLETERLGIKLIYTTRGLDLDWGNERYLLRDHGGQPPRRYEFLNVVQRIEEAITHGPAKMGYAIMLTNQPQYWNPPSKQDVIDAAFRLHHGRKVAGELTWAEHAGEETTRGKVNSINLLGSYSLHWRDYSRLGEGTNQQFRYLAVAVQ